MITLKVDCSDSKDYPIALLKDALRALCNQIGKITEFRNVFLGESLPSDIYLKSPYYKELVKAIDILEWNK